MKTGDVFPSDYMKTEDISGVGDTYHILEVNLEEFTDPKTGEKEKKPVVLFSDHAKKLILNVTNWKRLVKLWGDESDNWEGKPITLHLEAVEAFGETVDAIRVAPLKRDHATSKK